MLLKNETMNRVVDLFILNMLSIVVVTVNRKLMTLEVLPNNDLFPSMSARCLASVVLPLSDDIVIVLAGLSVVLSVSVVVSGTVG